jgi:hypothetical protein
MTPTERAARHVPCKDSQCHVVDHCARCAQVWPCDTALLLEVVLAVEVAEELAA